MRFAVAQAAPVAGGRLANLQQARDLVGAADAAGADLVVFPELHLSGYLDARLALRADDDRLTALSASAQAGVLPGFPEHDGDARFNSEALYGNRQLRHIHRELILLSYERDLPLRPPPRSSKRSSRPSSRQPVRAAAAG